MLPFGVTIPATVPQGSEFPEGLMHNPCIIENNAAPLIQKNSDKYTAATT